MRVLNVGAKFPYCCGFSRAVRSKLPDRGLTELSRNARYPSRFVSFVVKSMFVYQVSPSFTLSQKGSGVRAMSSSWVQNWPLISPSIDAGWNIIGQPAHGEPAGATAQRFARLGFPKSSPVSITATFTPCPSMFCPPTFRFQTSHALCSRAMPQLVGDTLELAPIGWIGFLTPARTRSLYAWNAVCSSESDGFAASNAVFMRTGSM